MHPLNNDSVTRFTAQAVKNDSVPSRSTLRVESQRLEIFVARLSESSQSA